VREDRLAGSRVFPAGQFITAAGGHSTENTPDEWIKWTGATRIASGPDDWRLAVREQFHKGADVIKLGSHFSLEEIKAAVEEAHELGLKVTVDAETFYIERAVEAGADTIEHPLPRTDKTIQLMAKKGVAADPTLIPYQIIFDEWGGHFGSTSRRFTFSNEANLEMLKKLRRAGIKCGIGNRFDPALVSLPARAVHSRVEEPRDCRVTLPRSSGSGDQDECGDSGHGRSIGHARHRASLPMCSWSTAGPMRTWTNEAGWTW
jgi:hypothetical protein